MVVLLTSFLASAIAAFLLAPFVARSARRWGAVDAPESDGDRKRHARPTPLLGGIPILAAFALSVGVVAWATGAPFAGRISPWELAAVLAGGALLVIGGALDDRFRLPPRTQLAFPLLAVGLVAAAGVGITKVTNPLGGVLHLAPAVTVAFTVAWLLGTTYTTKLLDGLDGLVAGITAIGALLIAALSLTTRYYQPDVAVLALALAGACIGFLPWNAHPARMFLGEGGSTFCGFLLGVLAIISGGKIATALLVLGVPAVDAGFVILQRLTGQGSGRIAVGDRTHLHFRLLDLGFSHRGAVRLLWAIAAGAGALTLVLQASGKFLVIVALAIVAAVLSYRAARSGVGRTR